MELGINNTVDDISAETLDQLRKELATLLDADKLESVMYRVAPRMHAVGMACYAEGEAVASGVVPEAM